jgi:citrate synthase
VIGIPVNMFTVMFAIGRLPGWIANWKEVWEGQSRIYRPRQVYVGPTLRDYVSISQRKAAMSAALGSGEVVGQAICR